MLEGAGELGTCDTCNDVTSFCSKNSRSPYIIIALTYVLLKPPCLSHKVNYRRV